MNRTISIITIVVTAILALMQIVANAQKAELVVQTGQQGKCSYPLASEEKMENSGLNDSDSKQFSPSKANFKLSFDEFRKAKPTDVFVVYLAVDKVVEMAKGRRINKC